MRGIRAALPGCALSACSASAGLPDTPSGLTCTDATGAVMRLNLEDRYGRKSTVVTSQLPVASWHHAIADATYADAILDRLVHNAHRVELNGDSLRRAKSRSQVDDATNN